MPVTCEFSTTVSSAYRIFLKVTGASASNECAVHFDDIRVQTAHYHGIIFGCDTTVNQDSELRYSSGSVFGKYFPSAIYDSSTGGGDYCIVKDGNVAGGYGRSYAGLGIIGTAGCSHDTIHNVDCTVRGISAINIKSDNGEYWRIAQCSLYNYATAGVRRDYLGTMPSYIHLTGGRGSYAHHSTIDSNYGIGSIYSGIIATTRQDLTDNAVDDYPLVEVFENTLHHQGRYSNDFAIFIVGQAGAYVHDNIIDSDTGDFYGRGIQIYAIQQNCYNRRPRVDSNTVSVRKLPRNQGYVFPHAYHCTYGIQIEEVYACTASYNTTAVSAPDSFDGRFGGAGLVANSFDNRFIRFHHNTSTANGTVDGWVSCVYIEDAPDSNGSDLQLDSNIFITNDSWLRGFSDLDSTLFLYNECQVTATIATGVGLVQPWRPFFGYDYESPCRDIRFVDNQYPNDSTKSLFKDSYFCDYATERHTSIADIKIAWYYGHTTVVNVKDSLGADVEGASVYFISGSDTMSSGATNASGLLSAYIWEFRDSAQTTTYDVSRDRDIYNDYTISVVSGVESADSVVTIEQAQTWVLTLGDPILPSKNKYKVTVRGVSIR